MKKFYVEFTAGLFVLAGCVVLAYLSVHIGGLRLLGEEDYSVVAIFSDVGGLRPGAQVSIAGVAVGSVADVDLVDYTAHVKLRLEKHVELPMDSIASVQARGIIGENFISISPGGDLENIEPGGRIRETEPAVNLQSLIAKYAFGEVD